MNISSSLLSIKPSPVEVNTNLILYLDAKDPYGNGSVVSSDTNLSGWADKSIYKNNTTALTPTDTATTIAYKVAGFNTSYPTLNFTGNSNRLAGTFPVSNGSTVNGPATRVFLVGSLNSSSVSNARAMAFSQNYKEEDYGKTQNWGFLRQSNTGISPYRAGAYVGNNNPSTYNIPLIWEGWFDGTAGYSTFLNANSTVIITNNSTAMTGNFDIKFFAIGHNTSGVSGGSFAGNISEILVYKGVLSSTLVQQIEGYLAWKWGLQATLPTSNPYKNSAPVNFDPKTAI